METDATKRLVRLKEAARILPISYTTLYRLAKEVDGPFLPAFTVLGDAYFLDVEKFLEIGQKMARKKALER